MESSTGYTGKSIAGTSQSDRGFKALDPEYVKIDEHSFEELLIFACDFSKSIHYYNLNNRVEGVWNYFWNDELILLASIINTNPSAFENKFKIIAKKVTLFNRTEKKIHYCRKYFIELSKLSMQFQDWYHKAKEIEKFIHLDIGIKKELENAIITQLRNPLGRAISLLLEIETKLRMDYSMVVNLTTFDDLWQLDTKQYYIETEDINELFKLLVIALKNCFQQFYETVIYLKVKASDFMEQSLRKNNHYPEISLFIAFLKLFKYAQNDINTIRKRHLDFYYSTVLKQVPLTSQADKLYLSFELYDGVNSSNVKKGTIFIAGEDEEGNDILYSSDESLYVNRATINKIRTLFLTTKKINYNGLEKSICTDMFSLDISFNKITGKENRDKHKKTYATFGEKLEPLFLLEDNMKSASLGFAVSSPILFMKEGLREVTLTIRFLESSYEVFLKALEELSYVEKINEEALFVKIFLEAFSIFITSEMGWMKITRYVLFRENKQHAITIKFDIDTTNPPIVAFDESIHTGKFSETLPIIRIQLNAENYLYPYSLLTDFIVDEIIIDIKVSEVKDIVLYNNFGQLSADNPFYPFGANPRIGSYLLIGNNEIFQKSLNSLAVAIEWFDLPKHSSGFSGYYKEYGLGIDNTSFEARIAILEDGRWKPEGSEQQIVKLFRSSTNPLHSIPTASSVLHDKTIMDSFYNASLKLSANYKSIKEILEYTNTTRRGFIKMELSNPKYTFGQDNYPSILSDAIIKKSRKPFLKFTKKEEVILPNTPYAPQIKSISLNYTASSILSLRDRSRKNDVADLRGDFYHIHPFGEQKVFPNTAKQFTKLIPDYTYEGALFIGFTELFPLQKVSFLVEMYDQSSASSEQEPAVIEWHYLADNEWHYLKPSKIIKDETNGFMKTGCIQIEVPTAINRDNTILEPDFFWLRATVHKNITSVARIVSIHTHVISATLLNNPSIVGQHLAHPLPAYSIHRSVSNIEGVQTINQPIASIEGRVVEDKTLFDVRVAENIRHKKRAILAWDYERLVLDKFRDVYKIVCLPSLNSQNKIDPGSVLIVAIPNNSDKTKEPILDSYVLNKIKKYLKEIISPFVKLEVRNPSYERIRISCSVKFVDGYNPGFLLQKLNDELNSYLSNKIINGQSNLVLGGKIGTSDVLSFMRTLSYVDFITKFSMIQVAKDVDDNYILLDTAQDNNLNNFIQASKPWSVLVSADDHKITILLDKTEERPSLTGINKLELGEDFIIQ